VTVVTGPTMSGKSVYLKSIALITYLAHVGSFVPADRCRVGLTDRIFTRFYYLVFLFISCVLSFAFVHQDNLPRLVGFEGGPV